MKHFDREPLNLDQIRVPSGHVCLISERCKGCGFCITFCPRQVLCESQTANGKGYRLPEVVPGKQNDCINCQYCSLICPEFAIYTEEINA